MLTIGGPQDGDTARAICVFKSSMAYNHHRDFVCLFLLTNLTNPHIKAWSTCQTQELNPIDLRSFGSSAYFTDLAQYEALAFVIHFSVCLCIRFYTSHGFSLSLLSSLSHSLFTYINTLYERCFVFLFYTFLQITSIVTYYIYYIINIYIYIYIDLLV